MRNKYYFILMAGIILLVNISCHSNTSTPHESSEWTAEKIIQKAIEQAGGESFFHSEISFDFRDKHYIMLRNGGWFSYQRIYNDSLGNEIRDVLNNQGFQRYLNTVQIRLPDTLMNKYSSSVNSVLYFASLPFLLNDDAVVTKKIGEQKIKNKKYYKIEIQFNEKNGGQDHQDVFLYWFDQETFQMDYFAYQYYADEGGIRFREAYNIRQIEGIRIADYHNYKPADKNVKLSDIDQFFEANQLILLSEINLKNVAVIHTKP